MKFCQSIIISFSPFFFVRIFVLHCLLTPREVIQMFVLSCIEVTALHLDAKIRKQI
jgi:hypothetical protein